MENKKNETIVISKKNIEELSFITTVMEEHIEKGGIIVMPKIISFNDLKGKFVEKDKDSFATVLEVEKDKSPILKEKDSIFLSFVLGKEEK